MRIPPRAGSCSPDPAAGTPPPRRHTISATPARGGRPCNSPVRWAAAEFGEVNVRRRGGVLEVDFTVAVEPQGAAAEGRQTGVALDASSSMRE